MKLNKKVIWLSLCILSLSACGHSDGDEYHGPKADNTPVPGVSPGTPASTVQPAAPASAAAAFTVEGSSDTK